MQDLIEVFENTRKLSTSRFNNETRESCRNTKVYQEYDFDKHTDICKDVSVLDSTSVAAVIKFCNSDKNKKVAILNFADGESPGGLVLQGATTQEECLCRASNLYETLILNSCYENYYRYNSENFYLKSSDRIIYSPDIVFFKDEDYNVLDDVVVCDVITCPAPIDGYATPDEVKNRMKCILCTAAENGVDICILGAWGCGVFGNSARLFAELWQQAISECSSVSKIVFAIPKGDNNRMFRRVFS